ncbi:Holliday junction resolvase RuvX [Conexibacter sp. DBS9H8]|uniref:Holliday junction resolvase RuvX n=1 Tax=Conexibacter sp. DBS9H8 TaxID=2937801 RepID=UPI00200CBFD4|nr:Holliday junction resolvase RuvX [Conexibacter sp. DBS9H8]
MGRTLALDYGSARCGVAVSDPTGVLARPLDPVLAPAATPGFRALLRLIDELEVDRVVIGLPLSLRGGDSDQTREVRAFAARLSKALEHRRSGPPVELYDERFTTRLAARDGPGARAAEDSRAAAHLLSSWLAAQP